jgi:hypothetical protein
LPPQAWLYSGTVIDEEQEARGGRLSTRLSSKVWVSPSIQCRSSKTTTKRLDLALAQQQALDRVERLLAPLERIRGLPGRLVHRHVEERQEGGHAGPSAGASVRTFPVTFLRIFRGSSRASSSK